MKAFISTEDATNGISDSSGTLTTSTWSTGTSLIADFVAPPLKTDSEWNGDEADATNSGPARGREIIDLTGVDVTTEKEREDIDFFSRNIQDHLTVRKRFEITINKKIRDNEYALLQDQADAGVDGSSIFPAKEQTKVGTGFRVFLRVSSGTGSGHMWYTFRNATYTTHAVAPAPAASAGESMTFMGNLYDIKTVPETKSTEATEL